MMHYPSEGEVPYWRQVKVKSANLILQKENNKLI